MKETKNYKVSIQKIEDEDVQDAVFKALELIDAKSLMRENMKILVKPNILMAKPPERATTTHPSVLRAVLKWLKQFNPKKIYVAESSGGQQMGFTENAMKISGILQVCNDEGVECVPFEKTKRKIYKIEKPLVLDHIAASTLIDEVDLIVDVPKIKTHSQCTLTCAIKNMFGTLILGNKARNHAQFPRLEDFHASLADIYSVSNPQLIVVDGYLCMEGEGPSAGDVVKMDLILAGNNGVAIDTVVSHIIDIPLDEIVHIKKAAEKGLGTTDLNQIQILGEKIEDVKRPFKKPKIKSIPSFVPQRLIKYASKKLFKAQINFDPNKCKLCGTCWSNCPVEAITPPKVLKQGNIPKWDSNKCISCYCCAELCPYEAIDLKVNYLRNAIFSWLGVGVILILLLIGYLIYYLAKLLS
ncbi:MAG: DUF362 domain-containing protein [Promethearchaeota archaeon]